MKAFTSLMLAAAVMLAGLGCRSKKAAPGYHGPVIFGSVNYRARVTLPPEAILTMRLLDVTRSDAPAVVLAEKSISGPGQPPLAFELPYPPEAVQRDRRTVLEARIELAGRLRFFSVTAHAITPDSVTLPQEVWVELSQ